MTAYTRIRHSLRNNNIAFATYGYMRRIRFEVLMAFKSAGYFIRRNQKISEIKLPPPRLRYWAHGDTSDNSFFEVGKNAYENINQIIGKYFDYPRSNRNYLDFGCGCARVLQHFSIAASDFNFYGTDIDRNSIEWNKNNLKLLAEWSVNLPSPPTKYDAKQFDVIVANSVFTHLNETYQFEWLDEFKRILSDRGILILTIHGNQIWEKIESIPDLQEEMLKSGFYFYVNNVGVRNFAGFPEFYQTAYHSKEYVYKNWTQYFEIVDYIDGGIANYQTAVVLKHR